MRSCMKIKIPRFAGDPALIVVPLGFEPRAAGLENLCSIQLSYGTKPPEKPIKAGFGSMQR